MKSKGFSLIELVVVITVMALISITLAPKFLDLTREGRVTLMKTTERALSTSVNHVQAEAIFQDKQNTLNTETGVQTSFDGMTFTTYNKGVPQEKWVGGLEQLFENKLTYLGSTSQSVDITCEGDNLCVVDLVEPFSVITDKGGFSMYIIPPGFKASDKSCAVYYIFELDGDGRLVHKEVGSFTKGC